MERKVVDEVSGWLKLFSDGSVECTWSGPKEVKVLTMLVPPSNDTFIDGVATKHIVMDEENGVQIHIYLPCTTLQSKDHKLGVLIHFKGGGFCVSHADWKMYNHIHSRLVVTSNVIRVSMHYRLTPEHRLLATIDECFAAIAWLGKVSHEEKEEAWLVHMYFKWCMLIGDSAGGNVVHQVALRALACKEELRPICLRGCVALHLGFVRSEL